MANEIRQYQIKAEESPSSPGRRRPSDNASANTQPLTQVAPATALLEPFERLKARQQLAAETRVEKNKATVDSSMEIDRGRISSIIGRGDRIFGKIAVRVAKIEGEAEGEISGDDIEIAASAVVVARIAANRLKVSGQVEGEIIARERVELLPTARLRCTITTPTLVISEGAQFDGDCKMARG